MRNYCNIAMNLVMWIVLAAMVYAIYGVLSQPMVYGDEKPILKQEILKPGYMPKPLRQPQIAPKRFSRSEGYLYNPNTGTSRHVTVQSYSNGNTTIYTGRVGRANIKVDPDLRLQLREK